jgi:antitoxin component of RelBE/YafQ-DinJ toxin-antitoxin module
MKPPTRGKNTGFYLKPQDYRILAALKSKLALDQSTIVRLALRALAKHEGLQVEVTAEVA